MKKAIVFSFVACIAAGLFLNFSSYATDENPETDLVMLSLEVYTQDEGSTSYGPAVRIKCFGDDYQTVCRCINNVPCIFKDCGLWPSLFPLSILICNRLMRKKRIIQYNDVSSKVRNIVAPRIMPFQRMALIVMDLPIPTSDEYHSGISESSAITSFSWGHIILPFQILHQRLHRKLLGIWLTGKMINFYLTFLKYYLTPIVRFTDDM